MDINKQLDVWFDEGGFCLRLKKCPEKNNMIELSIVENPYNPEPRIQTYSLAKFRQQRISDFFQQPVKLTTPTVVERILQDIDTELAQNEDGEG